MDSLRFDIKKHFPFTQTVTDRMAALMHVFGLTMTQLERLSFHHVLDVTLRSGDICFITGENGSGKSVLLREMEQLAPAEDRINLADIPLEANRSLIDCVELNDGSLFETLRVLGAAGLSDGLSLLTCPSALSEGQAFRYRMARALLSGKRYIFADEYLSSVDRLAAFVISSNLHRLAKTNDLVFIFASAHSDVITDLQPDVLVVKSANGTTDIRYRDPSRGKGATRQIPDALKPRMHKCTEDYSKLETKPRAMSFEQ